MEWTVFLFNTYIEVMTSNMTIFGDRAFKEIRLNDWSVSFLAAEDCKSLYSEQKQDLELTMVQIMSSLLQNSDLNWRK